MSAVASTFERSWFGEGSIVSALRSTLFWSSASADKAEAEDEAESAEEEDVTLAPTTKPPCHPVVCKILARRWVNAAAASKRRRYTGPHPVLCKILAHRWVKVMKAKRAAANDESAPAEPHSILDAMTPEERETTHKALVEQLQWQRETPLCLDNVQRLYLETRDMILGDRIYRLVSLVETEQPGKVTGMLLQGFSTEEIYNTLFNDEADSAASLFMELIAEAHQVLDEWGGEQGCESDASDAADPTSDELQTERRHDEWTIVSAKSRRRQRDRVCSP